jgi:hypothetical protein
VIVLDLASLAAFVVDVVGPFVTRRRRRSDYVLAR